MKHMVDTLVVLKAWFATTGDGDPVARRQRGACGVRLELKIWV